jgi:hypothetical protein
MVLLESLVPEDFVTLIYDELQISKAMVNFIEKKLIHSKVKTYPYKPHYAYYKDGYDELFDKRLQLLIDYEGNIHKSQVVNEFFDEIQYYYVCVKLKLKSLAFLN